MYCDIVHVARGALSTPNCGLLLRSSRLQLWGVLGAMMIILMVVMMMLMMLMLLMMMVMMMTMT